MNTFPKAHLMEAAENSSLDQDFVTLNGSGEIVVELESYKQLAQFMVALGTACHYQDDEKAQIDLDALVDMTDQLVHFPYAQHLRFKIGFLGWTWE